ncbi:hypothetical protein QJS10_CPB17g02285 [Acorus calamus]|uniref:Transmembrane protein n=1 Tax=Acorus calamus TaxID=4465 RepID=A0AAV9CX72_ACOCL|nr:hypothetical protein QJS10_CPB17g02285 [Acorus calamus]
MKSVQFSLAFNFVFVAVFFFLISSSKVVEGGRPLRDGDSLSSLLELVISSAYAGPNQGGQGH